MSNCMTCELLAARDTGNRPLWDTIYRTELWDIAHAYNTSLPGWIVLIVRRHIEAVSDLTREEAIELGMLIRDVSQALQTATHCQKTYVIQFAEAAEHPHVHVHIVPRMVDLPPERRGPKIFSYLGVPEAERVPEEEMDRIAVELRAALAARYPAHPNAPAYDV